MGNSSTSSKPKTFQVIMVGLDSAGKTTLAYKIGAKEVGNCSTSLISYYERFVWENLNILCLDLGGSTKTKQIWSYYFKDSNDGIIFVVDSKDEERMGLAKSELIWLLTQDDLKGLPLLLLANKQDLQYAMSVAEVTEKLGLDEIVDRKWYVQGTSNKDERSILNGINWLRKIMV